MAIRVAIKYCGGCDPGFDRVEYFESIRAALGGNVFWTRMDDGPYEALLLICGCDTACPEDDIGSGVRTIRLTDRRKTPAEVAAEILEK